MFKIIEIGTDNPVETIKTFYGTTDEFTSSPKMSVMVTLPTLSTRDVDSNQKSVISPLVKPKTQLPGNNLGIARINLVPQVYRRLQKNT